MADRVRYVSLALGPSHSIAMHLTHSMQTGLGWVANPNCEFTCKPCVEAASLSTCCACNHHWAMCTGRARGSELACHVSPFHVGYGEPVIMTHSNTAAPSGCLAFFHFHFPQAHPITIIMSEGMCRTLLNDLRRFESTLRGFVRNGLTSRCAFQRARFITPQPAQSFYASLHNPSPIKFLLELKNP